MFDAKHLQKVLEYTLPTLSTSWVKKNVSPKCPPLFTLHFWMCLNPAAVTSELESLWTFSWLHYDRQFVLVLWHNEVYLQLRKISGQLD